MIPPGESRVIIWGETVPEGGEGQEDRTPKDRPRTLCTQEEEGLWGSGGRTGCVCLKENSQHGSEIIRNSGWREGP